MKLIVGLGNPGREYESTRHNIGFMCVDNYVDNNNWKEKFNSLYQQLIINNETVIFVKPLTYMNLSGQAVRSFVDYFKIDINDILIIQDDLDLTLGKCRLKINSSAGGHNGIKSVIKELNTNAFARLKIGISNINLGDTKDYVLGKFSDTEMSVVMSSVSLSKNIISSFIVDGIEQTMNKFNSN